MKTKQQRILNLTMQQEKDKAWVQNPTCDSELLVNPEINAGTLKVRNLINFERKKTLRPVWDLGIESNIDILFNKHN